MSDLSPTVAPPAVLPWDMTAIVVDALGVLRLDPSDEDAERIATAATVATADIESELDYELSPWATSAELPAPVVYAAVLRTVEEYRRKDAPFGVADAWSVDGGLVRLSSDHRRGTRSLLAPYVSRRGVA